jgi:hypothetical protein
VLHGADPAIFMRLTLTSALTGARDHKCTTRSILEAGGEVLFGKRITAVSVLINGSKVSPSTKINLPR